MAVGGDGGDAVPAENKYKYSVSKKGDMKELEEKILEIVKGENSVYPATEIEYAIGEKETLSAITNLIAEGKLKTGPFSAKYDADKDEISLLRTVMLEDEEKNKTGKYWAGIDCIHTEEESNKVRQKILEFMHCRDVAYPITHL